jgi:regulator of protease activity HflC (stomatin/prohibitin superfamily)
MNEQYQDYILPIIFFFLGVTSQSGFLILLAVFLLVYKLHKNGKININDLSNLTNKFKKFNINDLAPNNNEVEADLKQKPMETINPNKNKKLGLLIFLGVVVIIFLSFIGTFFVIVDAGETGVQTFFGKVKDNEFHSGFHLKNPLVKVTKMNIRTQDYTMSIIQGEGQRHGSDVITALTKEGLSVDLDITVLYHLSEEKASDIYRDVGLNYDEVIIRPQIRSVIREVIAQYEAKDIYSEKRLEAAEQIAVNLREKLGPRGIDLEEVLLRHVELPADLAQSIQLKLQSEQEAQRYDFLLQTETKEAERKIIEAKGQRDAQQLINQSLTERYLQYLYIQNLQDREGTIYVPTNANNGVPLFRGI